MVHLKDIFNELIEDNTCVNCGNIVDESLRNWFQDKWVNIGKKDKSVNTHHVVQVVRNEDTLNVFQLLKQLV